uniref:Uncharacterized protein n=1 Tax=Anopheles albimanus TaxID=7167 RepID=A0A182FWA3_ANOAL
MGLVLAIGIPVALVLAISFFMKSSKEMPKNWSQFMCEVRMQICGFQAILEDCFMRSRNRVARSFRSQPGHIDALLIVESDAAPARVLGSGCGFMKDRQPC